MKATAEQIEKALVASRGIQSVAAQSLGISRPAIHKRIKSNERLQAVMAAQYERNIDYVESKLWQNIDGNHPSSIMFYLKCQGKQRGWIDRVEVTGRDGDPIEHRVVVAPAATPLAQVETTGRPLSPVLQLAAGSNGQNGNGQHDSG